jgi:hypothetical protein
MKAKPLPTAKPPVDESDEMTPLVPTCVLGSYKGGALKTALAVALAERLALAGLHVVLLACDGQEDARARLGLKPTDPSVARVARGTGTVTLAGMPTAQATQFLYRDGFGKLGRVDTVVVDTPPVRHGGSLPGVLLFATTDGDDATRNLCTMLRLTPKSTTIALVRYHSLNSRPDPAEWRQEVDAISQAVGGDREMLFVPDPLPRADPVKRALDAGQSVWELPRRGRTLELLTGLETMATAAWNRVHPDTPFPNRPRKAPGYVQGWDDDD